MHDLAETSVALVEARKLQIQQRSLFAPFCDKMSIITCGDLTAFDTRFIEEKGVKIENVQL